MSGLFIFISWPVQVAFGRQRELTRTPLVTNRIPIAHVQHPTTTTFTRYDEDNADEVSHSEPCARAPLSAARSPYTRLQLVRSTTPPSSGNQQLSQLDVASPRVMAEQYEMNDSLRSVDLSMSSDLALHNLVD